MANFIKTKIIATMGPSSNSDEKITELIKAGARIFRLNSSHGTAELHKEGIEKIRKIAKELGEYVAIILDLQGPKIRIGTLAEPVILEKNQEITLKPCMESDETGVLPVDYPGIIKDVKKENHLLLDDGKIELIVTEVLSDSIKTKVARGGLLKSRKGLNIPDSGSKSVSAITNRDIEYIKFAVENNIDYIALSFVRDKDDIITAKNYLKQFNGNIPIIAKIEKHEALVNLDEIVAETDGIMVARGDLALETRASEVPIWQKKMIQKCLEAAKPVITATQMLDSMTHSPRPTRAEISDVANAVIDHTDATMLSQESAMGKYPVETVTTMADIARDTEASPLDDMVTLPPMDGTAPPVLAMSAAACEVAKAVGAKAIFVLSRTGFTARAVSRHRPLLPIIAATSNETTRQQLSLSWGVDPYSIEKFCEVREAWGQLSEKLTKKYNLKKGDRIIAVSGLQSDRHNDWDESVRVFEV